MENLYTLNKLKDEIKQLKMLSFLLPKEKRKEIKELENRITEIETIIIKFKDSFANLGWCMYDTMPASVISEAVKQYDSFGEDAGEDGRRHPPRLSPACRRAAWNGRVRTGGIWLFARRGANTGSH